MVLVRRNELACRDEWSRSLWTSKDEDDGDKEPPFQRPATLGPAPPADVGHLRSLLAGDADGEPVADAAQGEDVLLSEARIVSESRETPAPRPAEQPAASFDPRTAVFRAREAYRERARAKANAARQSMAAEASSERRTALETQTEHDAGSEADPSQAAPIPAAATRGPSDRRAAAQAAPGRLPLALAKTAPVESLIPSAAVGERVTDTKASASPSSAPALVAAVPPDEWSLAELLAESEEPAAPEADAAGSPTALVPKPRDELAARQLPDWFRTDLPRICKTCRDYRPSAEGQRGWCANAWAFTHRRLVHEDDPAPCDSSIGDWWAPVDDVWLVAADVSSHGRATPLLDRLVGKEPAARRRS